MTADMPVQAGERKFVDLALDEVESDGSFSGYASLFGAVDLAKDVVERGAFSKALRERGAKGIRMLYQHDPACPIGTWTELREDHRGLFVRGRLATGVARAAISRKYPAWGPQPQATCCCFAGGRTFRPGIWEYWRARLPSSTPMKAQAESSDPRWFPNGGSA